MNKYIVLMLAFVAVLAHAEQASEPLKDPRMRDENISATEVVSEVSVNAEGHFVYTYDIRSSLANSGEILSFVIDIGCEQAADSQGFNPGDYPSDADPNYSEDGKHIPVAVDAPWGQAAAYGVGMKNTVSWLVVIKPGEERTGLMLISPYPPGSRAYELTPSVRYNEEQWDYSEVEEDDPEVPWMPDWTVTGMTTGPACPGEEDPDDGEPDARFDGSLFAGQSEELNKLLTYSQPLRDQFHVEEGTREIEMTIHYSEDIDRRTFRVTPERNKLRRLFNPRPGTSETVRIPLDPGKNRIELQVQTGFVPPGQGERPPREVQGRGGVSMDRDVFVIRVPSTNNSGKGRKKSGAD